MGLFVPDAVIVEAGLLAGAFTIVEIVGTKFPLNRKTEVQSLSRSEAKMIFNN
jgi:hypothetical protein